MSEQERYTDWVEAVMEIDSSIGKLMYEGEQCGMEPEECINEVLNKLYDNVRNKEELRSHIEAVLEEWLP